MDEGVEGSFALHSAALVRALEVVGLEEGINGDLKLVDIFKPGLAALNSEAFVKESAMESFKETVALRSTNLGRFVLDVLELEEKLVWVLVWTATEFAAIVGEDGLDRNAVLLKEGQDVIVEEVDGSKGHFGGVEPGESEAGVAVDGGLGIDAPDALEIADVEGVDSHQSPGMRSFDVALTELRLKALEERDLMVIELEGAFSSVLFEAQKALVLG